VRQWKNGYDRYQIPLAWLRADIHNAWMHQSGTPAKTALDFLPGKKPLRATWEQDKAIFETVAHAKGARVLSGPDKEAKLAQWLEECRQRRVALGQVA
jgi:hypothetical protein